MIPSVDITVYIKMGARICHMVPCASVKMVSCANTYLKYSYKPEIFFSNKTKNSLFNDEKISKIA